MYLQLNCKEILDSSKQMNPQVPLVSSFVLQLFGSQIYFIFYTIGLGHILNVIVTPHFTLCHNGFEGSLLTLGRIFVLFE